MARGGILEYLQAVLEIGRKQEDWRSEIEGWQGDLEKTKAVARFVYLSPAFTVLLLHEKLLRRGYDLISTDLKKLHLAHRLDVVMCDGHYPIYDALAPLFDGTERKELQMSRRDKSTICASHAYRKRMAPVHAAWQGALKGNPEAAPEQNGQLADLLEAAEVLDHLSKQESDRGLTLRVIRGGIERVFNDDLARQVLTAQPSEDSAAQLHALASLADSVASVAPEGKIGPAIATLQMELDTRSEKITESGRAAVSAAIEAVEVGRMSPTILACYLRELARTTKPG